MARTVDWHWTQKSSGGAWDFDGALPGGTELFGILPGHTLQRIIGWVAASSMRWISQPIAPLKPPALVVTSNVSVIGEPNGPRTVVAQAGGIFPAFATNTAGVSGKDFYAAYSTWSDHFDLAVRVANPNVNDQPIDLDWSWSVGTPQGDFGVPDMASMAGTIGLTWLALTTTPRSN